MLLLQCNVCLSPYDKTFVGTIDIRYEHDSKANSSKRLIEISY